MEKKHVISFSADRSEMNMVRDLESYHKRRTHTDLLRYLLAKEHEKIFSKNSSIELSKEGAK